MQIKTVPVILTTPKRKAVEYLSKVENLPKWATELTRSRHQERQTEPSIPQERTHSASGVI